MQKNKAVTVTFVFDANSANYGESGGNISELKKIAHNGNVHTMISRQAIGYNIRTQMPFPLAIPILVGKNAEEKGQETALVVPVVGNQDDEAKPEKKKGVLQFAPEATVKDFPELDMFGYLKTFDKPNKDNKKMDKRTAVVRVSDAISLSPFSQDLDFLTNMGLASRGENLPNNIANMEKHMSYYAYTITIDLDDIGVDNGVSVISDEEKANRVNVLLTTVEHLYRDIKGRRENLAPVFAIGGLYASKNPLFLGRVATKRNSLVTTTLAEMLEDATIAKDTISGIVSGIFSNEPDIRDAIDPMSVQKFFEALRSKVSGYYKG